MSVADRFDAFMHAHQDMVYTLACRLAGSSADAEDLSQQVFLRAWKHFAGLDGNPAAPGWLRVTTTRVCLNHLQRYRWRWRFFSELEGGDGGEEVPGDFASRVADEAAVEPGSGVGRSEWLEAALAKLPASQRVPLVLFHFESMPYEAIAEHLGVSLSKVKTDILRGREKLKALLAGVRAREEGGEG